MNQKAQISCSWMHEGTACWVELATEDQNTYPELFARADILSVSADEAQVTVTFKDETLKSQFGNTFKPDKIVQSNVYPDAEGYQDMVNMEQLNEAEILYNLKHRYQTDKIFTYIGPTLMAMNPYKAIPEQLSKDVLEVYQNQAASNQPFNLKDTLPHTYAVAGLAYKRLFENTKNQAIVISGESGAGKTENAKIAMKFLTSLSDLAIAQGGNKAEVDPLEQRIEDKILSCNPILEAFGNAKTTRNDNSSRFGKYVRMIVNSDNHQIKGAAITNYLLEKSRVVGPGPEERNYHVFYHLLKCGNPKLMEKLFLTGKTANDFEFLTQGNCVEVNTLNDHELFNEVEESFTKIKFTEEEQEAVWNILAAILHLGNISFDKSTLTDELPCTILKQDHFKAAAKLLHVTDEILAKSLLFKTREVGKSVMESPLNENDAIAGRNSFTSNYYDRLFTWLVKRLNLTIIPQEDMKSGVRKSVKDIRRQSLLGIKLSIGLLDIFGFENFKVNSFEQFCINYTNEKLQQLYISYVFKSEEQEFIYEGLQDQLGELKYSDNQGVMDVMDKTPTGIFDLLDESTQLGSGTDDALFQKIVKSFKDNIYIKVEKTARDRFIIVHTAKNVEYCVVGFRNKNKSEISLDILKSVLGASKEQYSDIFLTLCGTEIVNREKEIANLKKPSKSEKFLGSKFRQQMKMLMDELLTSDCHFVRCLKPNELKQKGKVVESFCLLQIKYLGVLESIRVRKEGFPFRKDYKVFYHQFSEMTDKFRSVSLYKQQGDLKEICNEIINILLPKLDKHLVLFGKTKFFAKNQMGKVFDQLIVDFAKKKQQFGLKIWKSWKKFKWVRELLANLSILYLRIKTFEKIQAKFKMIQQRKRYQSMKKSSIQIKKYLIKKDQIMRLIKWDRQVKLWRKIDNQKLSLTGLYKILQGGIQKRTIKRYSNQVNLIKEAEERKRIAEILRLEEIRRQEEERKRIEEEVARLAAIELLRIQKEKEKAEQEKADQLLSDQQRIDKRKAEQLKEEQEKADKEKADKEKADKEKADKEKADQEKADQEKADQEKADQEKSNQKKVEYERANQEKANKEKADQDRVIKEKAEQIEADRLKENLDKQNQDKAIQQKAVEDQSLKQQQDSEIANKDKQHENISNQQEATHIQLDRHINHINPQPLQEQTQTQHTHVKESIVLNGSIKSHQPEEKSLVKTNTIIQDQIFEKIKRQATTGTGSDSMKLLNDEWETQLQSTTEENLLRQNGKADEEDEISQGQKRRNMTMTSNILPFIPKEQSDLEKYACVGKSKKIENVTIGMSSDLQFQIEKLDKGFLQDVQDNKFFSFCMKVVKKRTSWLQDIPMEKLLMHQNSSLDDPLQDLPSKVADLAEEIFDIMLEYPKQRNPLLTVQKIIFILFPKPGEAPNKQQLQLRDETYLLIIKQMTNCPEQEIALKYLLLMVVICSIAPTSENAFFPILNYLYTKFTLSRDETTANMAKVAFVRLMKSFTRNRFYPPTEMELTSILNVKQIRLDVFIHESNFMTIGIEPYYDQKTVIEIMVKKLKMTPNSSNLGIVQQRRSIVNKQLILQEYFVDDSELIVNLFYKWVNESNRATYRLYFRIKVFFIYQPKDLDSICLFYFHFCEQYLRGNFGLSDDQLSQLAVYKLIADLGPGSDEEFKIEEYAPLASLQNLDQAVIKRRFKNTPNIGRMQAMEYFLDELRKQSLFMTWNFQCSYSLKGVDIEKIQLIVAIRPFQIYLCDVEHKKIQVRYHFLQVVSWGQSVFTIEMVTEDGQTHCLTMSESQANMFNELRKTYTVLALKQQGR